MPRRKPVDIPLKPSGHAVYRLAPDLLLVFKPKGHHEPEHAHPYRQRLLVLRGRLLVRLGKRCVTVTPLSRGFTLPADRRHETTAIDNTWLMAERVAPKP